MKYILIALLTLTFWGLLFHVSRPIQGLERLVNKAVYGEWEYPPTLQVAVSGSTDFNIQPAFKGTQRELICLQSC